MQYSTLLEIMYVRGTRGGWGHTTASSSLHAHASRSNCISMRRISSTVLSSITVSPPLFLSDQATV